MHVERDASSVDVENKRYDMKKHTWSEQDDKLLLKSIEECKPLFEHFKEQSASYSDMAVWDAVAGRMLPSVVVTGAACKRRYARITEERPDAWKQVADMVNAYERDLAETTFNGVAEILASMDILLEVVSGIHSEILSLKKMWE
jgi:hypothetical protein